MLTKATVKTGLFKRRLIHVARRFGAIREWVDFSNVSLRKLIKSFEDTAIFDEALKEAFTKDLDLQNTLRVFKDVRKGKISIEKVETNGVLTPIARVGVEKVSMKTDLIPSDRMRLIIVESAKARLLNETNTFVCTRCWDYVDMLRTKDLPNKPTCPKCGSSTLGLINKDEDKVFSLADKKGQKLTRMERKQFRQAKMTGQLMSKYGKTAAVALSSRRLRVSDVKSILREEQEIKNRFFELVIDAERKALKKKYW
jgi:ATP-dependent Lhr-like helicase